MANPNSNSNADKDNYAKAHGYWKTVDSSVGGMLGGFQRLHLPDINGSKQFIDELAKKNLLTRFGHALDCGSGIGRVTKHLLLPTFDTVDMVDFAEQFIAQSSDYIGEPGNSRIGHKYVESLHKFTPEAGRYDLIWVQWVTGHLADEHFVQFLQRCKEGLCGEDGCIVVKDNLTQGDERHFDELDCSWTRTLTNMQAIFAEAGLEIALERRQLHFPKDNYPVRMFALKPHMD